MDRLIEAIQAIGNPSVVGLDPTPSLVPRQIVDDDATEEQLLHTHVKNSSNLAYHQAQRMAQAYLRFNCAVIDAICDIVPAVKPQIAMYEALGAPGIDTYIRTCAYAHRCGLYVLGDIKRGDIGSTASAYAAGHLTGLCVSNDVHADLWHEDAITINPYLGQDGIEPFVQAADNADKDCFMLVHTSNPSSVQLQGLMTAQGMTLYEHVADLVEQWGSSTVGSYGYSRLGAVVGATHRQVGKALRKRMPHTFLLIPGYGAQGGTAHDVAGMFDKQRSGAIVNSSRGIIGAWKADSAMRTASTAQEALDIVSQHARQAAIAMRDALRSAIAAL